MRKMRIFTHMKLIADGGSTKTKWALLSENATAEVFTSAGLNPLMLDDEAIRQRIAAEVVLRIGERRVDEVWFYGAGCIDSVLGRMAGLLRRSLGGAECRVGSDMLGAARALCGHRRGIACVLGTGSNSCLYDGEMVEDNVSPLGYILGDEGSGAVIGRRLISDVYKRQLPGELCGHFGRWLGMSRNEVIERVYRRPEANVFLASLTRFVAENISEAPLRELVTDEFERFLRRNVMNYEDAGELPVHFTGSLASVFEPQLREALDRCGLHCGRIEPDPLPGMIEYHK